VPESLNTEDRMSVRYLMLLLSDRPRHLQGVCDTLTKCTLTQKMLIHKEKMWQTAREHESPILPQRHIHF
jgi:hypothetical protein